MPYTSSWKGLEIGGFTYNSGIKILRELEKKNAGIEPNVREILESPNYVACKNVHKLNIGVVTPGSLGFTGVVYQSTFFNKARSDGWRPIHSDAPLVLRVQYRSQSDNRFLYAGLENPILHKGKAYTFVLTASKCGMWIRVEKFTWDSLWPDHTEFLLQR